MNVPQLRFSGFDGEWEPKTIKNLGIIGRGKSKHRPRNDARLYGSEYPFVQTSDIKHAGLYLNTYSQAYSEFGLKQSKMWPKGTLCITIAANIAETTILDIEACFPDSIIGFTPDSTKSEVVFMKKYFDFINPKLQKMSEGIAQSNLNLEKLASIEFNVPSLQEQKKISAFFTLIEKKIEKQQEKIRGWEQFKTGMMQKIFSQELRFKDEGGGEFPEWNSLHFGDVVEKLIGGGTPSRQVEEYYGGSIPWVTVKDLKTNKYVSDAMEYITDLGLEKSSSKIVDPGDLIIPTRMAVGRVLIATEKVAINQDLKGCKLKSNYDTEFIYYLYFSKAASIERLGSGSTVSGINIEELMKIKIQVPVLKEQKKVANYLGKLDKKIEKEKEKLMVLDEQKRGFMSGIFV